MSAATETVMTPTLPMEPAPAKVVKKRGPKKKTAKEADNTDKNTPIETDKKMTAEKKEKKEKKENKEKEEDSESQDTATKKTRAPTLSANNKRFVQFTYFLLNKLKDTHPQIDTKPLYDTFKVFDTVEEQLLFLNTFDQDAVKSSMKQHKADLKKDQLEFAKVEKKLATKIKRTKNVSPFYEADNALVSISFNGADIVDDPKLLSSQVVLDALKLKTNDSKTLTLTQTQNPPDIVAQIVSAANNNNNISTSLTHIDNPSTYNTNTSPSTSESLDVQLCKIQDNTFLIDKNNNLYHPTLHTLLATFHKDTNTIQYI